MNEQPDLINVTPTEPPPLEIARRRLEAIEAAPPCYIKFTVERTSQSEVYIRVIPGTHPKDVPRKLIEEAARELDDSDWGLTLEHDYSSLGGHPVESEEAESYSTTDATGIANLRAEVARMEREEAAKLIQ